MLKLTALILSILLLSSPAWAETWCDDVNMIGGYTFKNDTDKLADCSVAGNTLTIRDNPSYSTSSGKYDGAYTYDGNDATRNDDISSDVDGTIGSLVFWEKRITKNAWCGIVDIYESEDNLIRTYEHDDGRVYTDRQRGGSSIAAIPTVGDISDGAWHHIGVTWTTAGNMCQTFDGTFKSESCVAYTAGPNFTSAVAFVIGNRGPFTDGYKGIIDEVGLFTDVKDNTDINSIMDGLDVELASGHRIPTSLELRNVTIF